MIDLKFYPEYIGDNEYIELFYRALEPYGVRARDGLIVWDKILREQDSGLDIIQFQWCPERIWRGDDPPRPKHLRSVFRLWKYLRLARRLGIRVIWTVHDFVHHESSRIGLIDLCGYRVLAGGADLCICHSEQTRRDVIRHFGSRPGNTVVMPIGNYDGIYPAPAQRAGTLRGLGLRDHAKTLVCFGMVRPYKGLELAIDALRQLGDDYQLIIVGPTLDPRYGDTLRAHAEGMHNVRLMLERVDKQRLADLIHASDCVLLPYRRITGSSAILAALTLGKGVVASDLPFFRDILAEDTEAGVLFKPGDVVAFTRAIQDYFRVTAESRNAAARRIADHYAWSRVIRPVADWLVRSFPDKVQQSAPAGAVE